METDGKNSWKFQSILYFQFFTGFQLRFCRVDAENGILSYFLSETGDDTFSGNPRGQVSLLGALINPSDEDSRTFAINPAAGESIKLKANDGRSRQEVRKVFSKSYRLIQYPWTFYLFLQWVDALRAVVENLSTQERSPLPPREHLAAFDCLVACRKQLQDTEQANAKLVQIIESLNGGNINHNDSDMLLLKALSSATTSTLSVGLAHLQKYQENLRTEMY